MNNWALGLAPISLGVTGHRDLRPDDVPQLRTALAAQLQEFARATPNSPRVLLTALAEGADQLAAQVALHEGWQIGAVLPMPQADYEQDFDKPEVLAQFRDLLARAAFVWQAPEQMAEAARLGLQVRDCAYRAAGLFILRHSHALLALWDGSEERKPGGTTDVVRTFQEGVPSVADAEDWVAVPDRGFVIHIPTPRQRNMDNRATAAALQAFKAVPAQLPANSGWAWAGELLRKVQAAIGKPPEAEQSDLQRWQGIWSNIDLFNEDATRALGNAKDLAAIDTGQGYLGDQTKDCTGIAARASRLYAVADCLSFQNQQLRQKNFVRLIALAVLAIFFEQLYSGPHFHPGWLLATLAAGLASWQMLRHLRGIRMELEYLDYRALAEACRVQHYWALAGLPNSAAGSFLRGQSDELEWLRQALLTTELCADEPSADVAEELAYVQKSWIVDQQKYFIGLPGSKGGNKAQVNANNAEVWGSRASLFFGLALLLMLSIAGLHVWAHPVKEGSFNDVLQYLIVAYGMAFAFFGAIKAWAEVKSFAEQARRYKRMGLNMQTANRKLTEALANGDRQRAQALFYAIGREALAETSDWLILHRDRPVTAPIT